MKNRERGEKMRLKQRMQLLEKIIIVSRIVCSKFYQQDIMMMRLVRAHKVSRE